MPGGGAAAGHQQLPAQAHALLLRRPYYGTITVAGPRCLAGKEVCDGKDNDCDGKVDEGGVCAGKDGGVEPKKDLGGVEPKKDLGSVEPKDGSGIMSDGGFAPLDEGCSCRAGRNPAPADLTLLGVLLFTAWWRRRN